ncbi:hypothetical protein ACL1HL_13175, partial [Corynebacterium striatum]
MSPAALIAMPVWMLIGQIRSAGLETGIIRALCQMRVLGTGVPETRYCRVPGSWYRGRADGVGPAGCFIRPGL